MISKIAFIGGGNMASSLIGGLLANQFKPENITVSEPDTGKCEALKQAYSVNTTRDNEDALGADVIILAVKPQQLQKVCLELSQAKQMGDKQRLFISIAAGVRSPDINRWLGGNTAIVRCMPNTPALYQAGATALFHNSQTSEAQKKLAEDILSAVGITVWVENEDQLDAVTAISGSGPAYFFLMMEALQKAGEKLGLSTELASQLTIQTALGAAIMANSGNDDISTLRNKVTSKGGTTESAIKSFEAENFQNTVTRAVTSARDRSISLADELGKDQK